MQTFLYALIFLPGTFIHELSHFLMAKILFVPVGKFNLIPQKEGNKIRLGSVTIVKTDLIRGSLIGIAPFIVGVGILIWILKSPITLLSIYIIFQTVNTMIPSASDLKAIIKLGFIALVIFLIYLLIKQF